MTKKQQKIYNGLILIGEDIAGFYRGGLEILYSHNPVKAHLLAHCGRELDGIMRDTFSYEDAKKIIQDNLKGEELDSLKKNLGKSGINGNIASILSALDVSLSSSLAKKWIEVSTQFAGYAHRDSERKIPRKFDECEKLWEMYEDVLFELVGNFSSIHNRVLRIINRPNEQLLDRLPNLFKNKALKLEFFKELKSLEWLIPLFEKGFFNPANIENEYPSEDDNKRFISPNWIELHYLVNMGQINSNAPLPSVTACLLKFINSYIDYRNSNGNPIKNPLTNMRLIELIITLPSNVIEDSHLNFIFQNVSKDSFISYDLIENFIPKLIKEDSKNILFKVIQFYLEPYEVIPYPINNLFDEESSSEVTGVGQVCKVGENWRNCFHGKRRISI